MGGELFPNFVAACVFLRETFPQIKMVDSSSGRAIFPEVYFLWDSIMGQCDDVKYTFLKQEPHSFRYLDCAAYSAMQRWN